MKVIQLIPLVLLLLISCGRQKEESVTAPDTLIEASAEPVSPALPEPTHPTLVEYKNFLWDLDKSDPYSVRAATEKFATLFRDKSKSLGDTAIVWFEQTYAAITNRVDEHHQLNPERYDSLTMTEEGLTLSPFLTGYRDSLADNGLRVTMEEGGSNIQQNRAFMEKAIYPYVSAVMVEYLKQVHQENEEGFSSDGGLVIEPETLATRIGWWEQFYAAHPDFIFQDGREWQKIYISVLMTGMDNTPQYPWAEGKGKPALDEYYVTAYTTLFTKYPKSKATKQLQPYYQLLLAYDTAAARRYPQPD